MNPQEKALNVLISAVQVATKRGAFELAETEAIVEAVKTFTNPAKEEKEEKVESKKK